MGFRGQYGLMVALAILPTGALAKDKSVPLHLEGNPGSFFGPDAYPPEAIRAEQQGRVVARVTVDATGAATGCDVSVSSGAPSLDARTCEIAMAKLHFTPPRDSRGRPITATYVLPVRWVLPSGPDPVSASVVTFSGTADAPVCSVMVDRVARHIVPQKCRALLGVVLAQGGSMTQSISMTIPDRPDFLLPLGE